MIGRRISDLRNERGLSQVELAKRIGISRSSLSLYEIEKREPDSEILTRIADFFNVSTDYIYGRTDESPFTPANESDVLSKGFPDTVKELDFLGKVGNRIFAALDNKSPISKDGSWGYKEMAEYFSLSEDDFLGIIQGETWPPIDLIEKASKIGGVSTDYLLCLTDNKRQPFYDKSMPYRFSPISQKRINRLIDEYDKELKVANPNSDGLLPDMLCMTPVEFKLLREYGFILHLQILDILCNELKTTSDYLLGRTDEAGNKMLLAYNDLEEDNKDILLGDVKKTLRDQILYGNTVAADKHERKVAGK